MLKDIHKFSRREAGVTLASAFAGTAACAKHLTTEHIIQPDPKSGRVETGLERLIRDDFKPLQGQRIGLVTNPTGVDSHLRTNIDILHASKKLKLVKLFGPEHGVRGDAAAGSEVGNSTDKLTGLPVYSLYGKSKRPSREMLSGLDALVFDIQDIGARSYTYISTMGLCMEAAAEFRIPFYVLDRPNPAGGNRVEGNLLEPAFRSFIGRYRVPYLHGLTLGEMASYLNSTGNLEKGAKCQLKVILLSGWRRDMAWNETGLPWVPSSPHIPHAETSLFYSATGMLTGLSNGVGYTLPFELAGAPGLNGDRLAKILNSRHLPGVTFSPLTYVPFYAKYAKQSCGGVQLHLTEPNKVALTRLNFEIMDAVRKLQPNRKFFTDSQETREFDLACGTNKVRQMIGAGTSSSEIWNYWNKDSLPFQRDRKPYLLYA